MPDVKKLSAIPKSNNPSRQAENFKSMELLDVLDIFKEDVLKKKITDPLDTMTDLDYDFCIIDTAQNS